MVEYSFKRDGLYIKISVLNEINSLHSIVIDIFLYYFTTNRWRPLEIRSIILASTILSTKK